MLEILGITMPLPSFLPTHLCYNLILGLYSSMPNPLYLLHQQVMALQFHFPNLDILPHPGTKRLLFLEGNFVYKLQKQENQLNLFLSKFKFLMNCYSSMVIASFEWLPHI